MKIIKDNIFLFLIILLALFLRFYKLSETFVVIPETGQDLMIARDAILNSSLPLHGVVSSHVWLYFGPLYWWVLTIFEYMFSFDPLGHAFLGRIGAVVTVIAVYVLMQRIVNKRTALFSAFFVAISPLFMQVARVGRHDSFSTLFSLLFLYILSFSEDKQLRKPFLVGLILGCGINIEYTFLLMIPVFVSFVVLKRIKLDLPGIGKFLIGFLIPFIPLIYLELTTSEHMLSKIILWVPYRVLGFLGIIKSDVVVEGFANVSYSFWKLIPDSFLFKSNVILIILLSIPIFVALHIIYKKYLTGKITSAELLLVLVTFWYIAGLVIHTNPPSHYFAEIYFIPILFICYVANYFWKREGLKHLFLIFTVVVFSADILYYFSPKWFYKDYSHDKSSYVAQSKIIHKLLKDAKGRHYDFERKGLFDDRKNYFADQYIYLLWYYGNPPLKSAPIKYIIYDEPGEFRLATKNNKKVKIVTSGLVRINK